MDPTNDQQSTEVTQARAPIYETLVHYQRQRNIPLHTPGHKGVQGPREFAHFLTRLGLACDLPSMDNCFHPQGCVAEAQHLAAELYGAGTTFYLVNGSSIGVQAMLLAAVGPGEKVLLPRNFHLSAFSALVLSGATPVYLPLRWLDSAGPLPPTIDEIEQHLQRDPDIRAVFLVHPTYYGLGRPLHDLADLCHRRQIALLVDEAHGAHLRFLPAENLHSAVDDGADVIVQSVHKTLYSLVGTAQMHCGRGDLISHERLRGMLNLLQSTSPNYLLLASLDLTRRWMWSAGQEMFLQAAERATVLKQNLNAIDGIQVLDVAHCAELAGCQSDPLRMVINVSGLGLSGLEAAQLLQDEFQLVSELNDETNMILVLGPADTPETYCQLQQAFSKLAATYQPASKKERACIRSAPVPPMVLTPREAWSRPKIRVPLKAALNRICGEMIAAYPPAVPLICPGEQLTAEIMDLLQRLLQQQVCILAEDPSLITISVVLDLQTFKKVLKPTSRPFPPDG